MDFPRHQLLPSATLSADQYGRRSGRHLPDEREDLLHGRRDSHQVPEYAAKAQVALERVGSLQTSLVADRAFQQGLKGARFHRLLEEPECLEIVNRGKRLFHAAEGGEEIGRSEVAPV